MQGPAILHELPKAGIHVPIVGIGGITIDRVEEVGTSTGTARYVCERKFADRGI